MENFILRIAIPAGLVAITLSHSVGGFCARMALTLPLAWAGIIDFDTMERLVLLYGDDL